MQKQTFKNTFNHNGNDLTFTAVIGASKERIPDGNTTHTVKAETIGYSKDLTFTTPNKATDTGKQVEQRIYAFVQTVTAEVDVMESSNSVNSIMDGLGFTKVN